MPIERRDGYRLWTGGPVPRGFDGITIGSTVVVGTEYVVSATKAATQGAPENPLTSALASQKSMKTATVVEGGAIAVDIILAELK